MNVDKVLQKAARHLREGDAGAARSLCEEVLSRYPKNQRARQMLSQLSPPRVHPVPVAPPGSAPDRPALSALMDKIAQGHFQAAATGAETLLARFPSAADLHKILGLARLRLGQPDRALISFQRAADLAPEDAETQSNLGVMLKAEGRRDAAIACFRAALACDPNHVDAHFNLGNALLEGPEAAPEAAAESYRRALDRAPGRSDCWRGLGSAQETHGEQAGAILAYRKACDTARSPVDIAAAQIDLGRLLMKKFGPTTEAEQCFRAAIAAQPELPEPHASLAGVLRKQRRYEEALACFATYRALAPKDSGIQTFEAYVRREICDWSHFELEHKALAACRAGGNALTPFSMLFMTDDPAFQLKQSQAFVRGNLPPPEAAIPAHAKASGAPLRIGYFSADFHDHATMHLLSGVLRCHDRSRFEIHCYNFGGHSDHAMRALVRRESTRFEDVTEMSATEVRDLARSHRLDIAIDLKGFTTHGRPELFQRRLAPVQISYLGFPGSSGMPNIDFIVADPVVIPDRYKQHYCEKRILLPGSYQPNDNRRPIAVTTTRRADFELPETAFVFCVFNASHKHSPEVFAIWMRLLRRIDGAVLWFCGAGPEARRNLRAEAARQGIDPARLVFAEWAPQAEHLARHKHADLFLDTFHCNAHTTASDALWAGLPVVTLAGAQFAARVAASLLTAVGLPELVTETASDYEALAYRLATQPQALAALRDKLASQRLSAPLFDTESYTRDFEHALCLAHEQRRAGGPLKDIRPERQVIGAAAPG